MHNRLSFRNRTKRSCFIADGKDVEHMAAVMSKSEMKQLADIAMKKHKAVVSNWREGRIKKVWRMKTATYALCTTAGTGGITRIWISRYLNGGRR